MVTRVRFERTTPSFGGWCSIQLSYRASRRKLEQFRGLRQVLRIARFERRRKPLHPQNRDESSSDPADPGGGTTVVVIVHHRQVMD